MFKKIDLSNSAGTDKNLPIFAKTPNIYTLRLKGAEITDEWFRDHLLNKESLKKLDLRETDVASKTKRKWK